MAGEKEVRDLFETIPQDSMVVIKSKEHYFFVYCCMTVDRMNKIFKDRIRSFEISTASQSEDSDGKKTTPRSKGTKSKSASGKSLKRKAPPSQDAESEESDESSSEETGEEGTVLRYLLSIMCLSCAAWYLRAK